MRVYSEKQIETIKQLRAKGYTYPEIQTHMGQNIPKGSLSFLCRDVVISQQGKRRIAEIIIKNRDNARLKAIESNKLAQQKRIKSLRSNNLYLAKHMRQRENQLTALAMLYLGEGAKWKGRRGLMLGSSDPRIINLYIDLLRECYGVPLSKLKARVQHRADQDSDELMAFWSTVTGIPLPSFYPSYVDKRTIGKVTKKTDYKGVCTISGGSTDIQLELEQIADIIGKALRGRSSVD